MHSCCAFLLAFVLTVSSEQCVKKSPCRCDYPNYMRVDLGAMVSTRKFISATRGNFTVYYHGCNDAEFKHELKNLSGNNCRGDISMCLFNRTDRRLLLLGNESSSTFVENKDDPKLTDIVYQNGTVTTIVHLICAPDSTKTSLNIKDVSSNQFTLEVFSASACRFSTASVISTGTRLLIMYLWFTIFYLVGGACVGYFIAGARGIEMLPHHAFWMKVPGLVKDGFLFLSHGCDARAVSTYNEM